MGRPNVSERDHFILMKNVPKSKGGYSYYTCKHCTSAHNKNPDLDPPELYLGRPYNYVNHFNKREAYQAVVGSIRGLSFDDCGSSTGSSRQRKRPVNTRLIFTKTPTRTSKKSSPKKKPKRRFSKVQKLERVLVEFQSGNFLPDLFIERPCSKALLEYLCPGITAYLPSRRVALRGTTLHVVAKFKQKQLEEEQNNSGGVVNFLSDVWQNTTREHVMSCQHLLFGRLLTYALPKAAGSRHDGVVIAQKMDTILNQASCEGWNVGAVVTDNAGQSSNIVKAVLKSSFADVAKDATAAVKTLNASSAKWLVRARALMEECYKKTL
ncbi:Hypothetical protein PHPALM_240 [Phytophthora palmivora]|uniref:DUF659 domain-containing protein n=1 Tax=Phytophthora palmivora TaxID=4796 RepID=A0A2P4YVD4_9STRA|nr:Hypothetical protein PHPALM_240 [Phytophthora palmivora]